MTRRHTISDFADTIAIALALAEDDWAEDRCAACGGLIPNEGTCRWECGSGECDGTVDDDGWCSGFTLDDGAQPHKETTC